VAIRELVEEAVDVFVANHASIMAGTFENSLIDHIPSAVSLSRIRTLMDEKIYTDPRVLSVEVAGFEIIYPLLERFAGAAIEEFERHKKGKAYTIHNKKILGLMPEAFQEEEQQLLKDPYLLLHSVTDFVAGMTDTYAVSIFHKISGQKFVT
jgi:dGTPase